MNAMNQKFWTKFIERAWLVFLAVGLLFVFVGVFGRSPIWDYEVRNQSVQIPLLIFGFLVVCASMAMVTKEQFFPNAEISVTPLTIPPERLKELNANLMLLYTGIKRTASTIADSYVKNIDDSKRQLRIMRDLVDESLVILSGNSDLTAFGELLDEAWRAKKGLSAAVTNSDVDDLYHEAKAAGAMGGKLLGAGGGGFMLLFVPPERQQELRDRLSGSLFVPFKFEYSGSQIIFFDSEQDYSAEEKIRAAQSLREFRELRGGGSS